MLISLNQKTTSVAMILAGLFLLSSACQAESKDLVERDGDTVRVKLRDIPAAYVNPWPKSQEDAYWQRANALLNKYGTGTSEGTTGEHEKWSIPRNLLAFLNGNEAAAVKALQATDLEAGRDHRATEGIDFYWSFTLKGQMRKYFFLRDRMDNAYVEKMKKGAKMWTQRDPKPTMELVLALDHQDKRVREYALKLLQEMRANLTEEAAEKATNDEAKAAILAYLKSDMAKADFGSDKDKWMQWWAFFSNRGWKVFEEVERLINPHPHPVFGRGSGPVGATWNPSVRGFAVDARNTDNLRAMREVAVYLMAEETGNEETRLLYKQKLLRSARGFMGMGMGEWDSESYHGHSIAAYLQLYDYAKDPEVRGYAKAILDYLSTAAAVKYYQGSWGGPVKRDYGSTQPWATSAKTVYPWFGNAPLNLAKSDLEHAFVFTSSYRPPMAVVKLAEKDFTRPVELLNTHPTYSNWLPGEGDKPAFHETLFVGKTFMIGTLVEGNDNVDTCGFKLLADNAEGTADYVMAGSTRGKVRNATVGSVGADRLAQYRNMVVFGNASQTDASYVLFVPTSAQVEIDGDLAFIKLHKTWAAVKFVNTGNIELDKINPGKRVNHLRSISAKGTGDSVAGFVFEVSDAAHSQSYQAFKTKWQKAKAKVAKITGKSIDMQSPITNETVGLSLGDGVKITRNGQAHDFEKDHRAVYSPAGGSKAPIHLGWKEYELHVEAGGYTFTGKLDPMTGKYVSENKGPGIE